jgi:hypothetical protein
MTPLTSFLSNKNKNCRILTLSNNYSGNNGSKTKYSRSKGKSQTWISNTGGFKPTHAKTLLA